MIKDSLQLCGLWRKKSEKGNEFLVGSFLGIRVLVFKNTNKTDPKQPDFRVVLAPKEDRPENHAPQSQAEASGELPF